MMIRKVFHSNLTLVSKLQKDLLKNEKEIKTTVINYISMSESHSCKPWKIEKVIEINNNEKIENLKKLEEKN